MDLKDTNISSIGIQPGFGSSANFTANMNSITFGDNYTQNMPNGINCLKMELNLNFNELVDSESYDLISFLQKQFYYEPQNYHEEGYFDNKRLEPFDYQPFYPYKTNKFNCLSYSHSKSYYNVNSVDATFVAVAPSILDSVEVGPEFNPLIHSSYELKEDGYVGDRFYIIGNQSDNNLPLSDKNVLHQKNTYKSFQVDSLNLNLAGNSSDFITLLDPIGVFSDYDDGYTNHNDLRHSIFIDKPNECSFYPYKPLTSNGFLDVRMFDFRPDNVIKIDNTPKYKESKITDSYSKYNKYGFNPNLNTIQLNFSSRSNLDAKRILLFLESHLGYKKFGFHIQKDYGVEISDDINTTPHRKNMSYFSCPNWSHTYVYFNNHTISATFVESPNP